MRLLFIAIISCCFFNYSFSQEKKISSDSFSWYSGVKSGRDLVLKSDSSAYCYEWGCLHSTFKFGSWSQRGDTIVLRTYKYLEADTFSYYSNQDTTALGRIHNGQLVISVQDCSGITVPNFVLDYYDSHGHGKKLKASAKGEIIIPQSKFSGLFGPYDLRRFLNFGLKNISVFICQEEESSPQRLSAELDIRQFLKTEKGLVEISSNFLFERK
jgi:hypothetical protein